MDTQVHNTSQAPVSTVLERYLGRITFQNSLRGAFHVFRHFHFNRCTRASYSDRCLSCELVVNVAIQYTNATDNCDVPG